MLALPAGVAGVAVTHTSSQETPLAASSEGVKTWRDGLPAPEFAARALAVSRQLFHAVHALHLGFVPVVEKINLIVKHRCDRVLCVGGCLCLCTCWCGWFSLLVWHQ